MSLSRTSTAFRTAIRSRAISTTPLRLAQGPTTKTVDPSGKPQTTQGHTTTKSHGLDVQNDNANAGQAQKAQSGGDGANQPIDAARMGGGEAKPGVGKGAFKDQVGGQGSGGVEKGGKTDVPEGGWTGKIKNALTGNKAFHTSARANADSPRKPVEKGLKGDQNEHLKHKSAGASDSGKGNAAKEPHLPSHNKGKSAASGAKKDSKAGKGAAKGTAGIHTSARVMGEPERKAGYAATHEGEPKRAGYDAPPEALPSNIESTYNPSEATPPPKPNMTPSSEAEYSSTAVDPPNQALKEQIKSGSAPTRNPPPSAEGGKQGLGEAWKNRKIA